MQSSILSVVIDWGAVWRSGATYSVVCGGRRWSGGYISVSPFWSCRSRRLREWQRCPSDISTKRFLPRCRPTTSPPLHSLACNPNRTESEPRRCPSVCRSMLWESLKRETHRTVTCTLHMEERPPPRARRTSSTDCLTFTHQNGSKKRINSVDINKFVRETTCYVSIEDNFESGEEDEDVECMMEKMTKDIEKETWKLFVSLINGQTGKRSMIYKRH